VDTESRGRDEKAKKRQKDVKGNHACGLLRFMNSVQKEGMYKLHLLCDFS
jgi:hypothetical protein